MLHASRPFDSLEYAPREFRGALQHAQHMNARLLDCFDPTIVSKIDLHCCNIATNAPNCLSYASLTGV
jgi:hypothetical protein